MCPTYPGQALWNTRFPAGVLPSPARYSFWVHIWKRPQRLEVGCGDRAWTWRKGQVFDWCVTLCLITNRSLPLRVLRLLCRQKLQMLNSISKVSSLWWPYFFASCCPHIIFSSGDMTTMTTMTTIDVQETTTALLLGLTTWFSWYNYLYLYLLVSWKGVWWGMNRNLVISSYAFQSSRVSLGQ